MQESDKYLALLRGINVGGRAKLRMVELKSALISAGLKDVTTYIQSGNVVFTSTNNDVDELAGLISRSINDSFRLMVDVVVFNKQGWASVIKHAPTWWGKNSEWKHNLLVLLRPFDIKETMRSIGTIKPDIEAAEAGEGVVYQSMSIKLFGRTTTGKLSVSPIYKRMTIRNYNTSIKLLGLLNQD